MRKHLINLFIFLGPLGNLLTPGVFPSAFRTYYFVLLGFPFLFNRLDKKQQKLLFLLLPFFLYCLLSSVWGGNLNALPRFFLLFFQFLFVLGAASYLNNQKEALAFYLKSFFISVIVGYVFFLGFYLRLLSFATIERFSVLGQFGYGLLRFSIGSYPNEYGIVASFICAVLLLWLSQKDVHLQMSRKIGVVFLGLTSIALLLTTTRSAYVACFLSIIYVAWIKKRVLLWAVFLSVGMLGFLKIFNVNILKFIIFGFDFIQVTEGSMGSRVILWQEAWEEFFSQALWGQGFAAFTDAHNVYLQLMAELGLIGAVLLLVALSLSFFKRRTLFPLIKKKQDAEELFLKRVRLLGIMHVLWFALTNHNLNHHLTWFVILLYLASWLSKEVEISLPNKVDNGEHEIAFDILPSLKGEDSYGGQLETN
jgi:O-antigen ligase